MPFGPSSPPVRVLTIDNVGAALACVGAAVASFWGVAQALPTGLVMAGFEPPTQDNHRVILQEWLAEAVTMFGLASIVIAVTGVASPSAAAWVYRVVGVILLALAALTALTGARTAVVWFKVCPVLLAGSACLLLVASVVS